MRLIPTGRGNEVVERWGGPTDCTSCGKPLRAPNLHVEYQSCSCTPDRHGHRVHRCLGCLEVYFDPPCSDPVRRSGSAYGYG